MDKAPDKIEDLEPLTPKTFGQMLRLAREGKGFTVEQVASATKILQHFIVALEQGEFEKLPGIVFGRGFIKSICKTIELPVDDFMRDFDLAAGRKPEVAPEQNKNVKRVSRPLSLRPEKISLSLEKSQNLISKLSSLVPDIVQKNVTPLGLLGALAAICVVLSLVILSVRLFAPQEAAPQQMEVTHEEPAPNAVPPEAVAEQEVMQQQPSEPATAPTFDNQPSIAEIPAHKDKEQPIAVAPEPPVQPVAPPIAQIEVNAGESSTEQLLEIHVKKSVRVRMQVDKQAWQTLQLEPQIYKYPFKDSAHLLVFNAAAVDVVFNGKPLGELGSEGRVRRLSFMAQPRVLENSQKL